MRQTLLMEQQQIKATAFQDRMSKKVSEINDSLDQKLKLQVDKILESKFRDDFLPKLKKCYEQQ